MTVFEGCGYCGALPAHDHDGIWACRAHEDLPELERAVSWLEGRACKFYDGHKHTWTREDARAVKVIVRAVNEARSVA